MRPLVGERAYVNPPSMFARSTIEHGCRSLFSLAFNPDGTLLAGGGDIAVGPERFPTHGIVVLWEPTSGREVRRLEVQSAPVLSVAFSPTGQLLAAGSNTLG